MFSQIETLLLALINTVPLELFVFVGSFVEEVIAPVPSLAVMVASGAFAAVQERTLIDLLPLAVIAAVGKTLGAIIVYYLSGKIGSVIITKFGWFFKVSYEDIEQLGKKITGGPRDYFLLSLFRALPILPSSVVSIGCGVLQIPFRLFLVTTFIGTIIRDGIFLYVGYRGTTMLSDLANSSVSIESYVQMAIVVLVVGFLGYIYFKRK